MTLDDVKDSLTDDFLNGQIGEWHGAMSYRIKDWKRVKISVDFAFDAEQALILSLAEAPEGSLVPYSGVATISVKATNGFLAKHRARFAGKAPGGDADEVSWDDHAVDNFQEISRTGNPPK